MAKINVELNEEPVSEAIHRVTRATLSTIPVLGGAVVEAFSALIEPPMSKRRNKWMIQVTEAINDLYDKNLTTLDKLLENEIFFTTLIRASQIAISNHQEEKIIYLKSAVINTALNPSVEESLQQYLVNLIDELTVYHTKVLKLFNDPILYAKNNNLSIEHMPKGAGYSRYTILVLVYPELKNDEYFLNQIWNDLTKKGLLRSDRSLNKNAQGESILFGCSTPLGTKYLNFISAE